MSVHEDDLFRQQLWTYGAVIAGAAFLGLAVASVMGAAVGAVLGFVFVWRTNPQKRLIAAPAEGAPDTQRVLEAHAGTASSDAWEKHAAWKKAMEEDGAVFEANLPRLRTEHLGKFVGIQNGKIVMIGATADEVQAHLQLDQPFLIGPIRSAEEESI